MTVTHASILFPRQGWVGQPAAVEQQYWNVEQLEETTAMPYGSVDSNSGLITGTNSEIPANNYQQVETVSNTRSKRFLRRKKYKKQKSKYQNQNLPKATM